MTAVVKLTLTHRGEAEKAGLPRRTAPQALPSLDQQLRAFPGAAGDNWTIASFPSLIRALGEQVLPVRS